MNVFDISEANIIETGEAGRIGCGEQPSVRISRNQTEPNLIEDGVDSIELFRESEHRFCVAYWGYLSGRLWVTHAGVCELKQAFLDGREDIPDWTLSTPLTELPDWFPTPEWTPSPVSCDECDSLVPVTEIVTPWGQDTKSRYCQDCWSSLHS